MLLISILVNTSACYGKVHVPSVNLVFAYRDVWNHIVLTASFNSDGKNSSLVTKKKKTLFDFHLRDINVMLSIANLQLFELFKQVCMSVSLMFHRAGRVGSVGHYGFKASFTDGLCGVQGLDLTVGNDSEIFPYFALCVCFFNKHRTVGRSTHASFRHVCRSAL